MFLYSTVSTLNPIVGIVVTISPNLSLYKIVVLPAASNPTINILISFLPKRPLNKFANMFPMLAAVKYPESPFGDDFRAGILWELGDDDETTVNEIQTGLTEWLCEAPKITSFRVNTLKADVGEVLKIIKEHVRVAGSEQVAVEKYPHCKDAIIVHHPPGDKSELKVYEREIMVDPICASAVLRGAHIYAPGVMAMMTGTEIGDHVSVYADLAKGCKKGLQKHYRGEKVFIGNGLVEMERYQLFCEKPQTGIAVRMIETTSNCPPALGDDFLPPGMALLQNLPSIICVHVLKAQPLDIILDMCASPGNKTTHIAALIHNKGRLVAIDKTPSKVAQLRKRCDSCEAEVEIIQADSTKLIEEKRFPNQTFDKILLDAPCSALGKRPQLVNTTTRKVLRSYVPLQRKLFENAVQLLKVNGTLVYSTCTISLAENEGIVAWALKTFKLDLVEAAPVLAGPGLEGANLTHDQLQKVQRFGPGQAIDSVGFFIAKFVKKL